MARNYKRLGGIINASAGPAKARAVFAESFGILRKNVVNLRENPVSSRREGGRVEDDLAPEGRAEVRGHAGRGRETVRAGWAEALRCVGLYGGGQRRG